MSVKKTLKLLEQEVSKYTPIWSLPVLWDEDGKYAPVELGEIKRTVKALDLDPRLVKDAVLAACLEVLRDKDWAELENTDSWGINLKDARRVAKQYGMNLKRILQGFRAGAVIPAPIVLFREDEKPYLIGGNTRLMAASAVGVRPKILAVRMPVAE